MKKIILFSALALLLSATIGCEKDEIKLPPATQTGANTLGCKINGKPFATTRKYSGGGILAFPSYGVEVGYSYTNDDTLFIYAKDYGNGTRKSQRSVFFSFKYDKGLGKYTNIKNVVEGTNSYVEITRFSDGIISGRFEITKIHKIILKDENHVKNDTLITKYTDGRFDVRL